jgi:UTP-glucose-1-phosphate uridylyltransferase
MRPALVVLAAGIGRRYGRYKQIEAVGPGGSTLVEYTIFDALRAGFGRSVFVIRRDLEDAIREAVGRRLEARIDVSYVFQDIPAGREKPWGTGDAVLAAGSVVSEPFAVANADDFYGAESFRKLATLLRGAPPTAAEWTIVGFRLGSTLSAHGPVARAVCETSAAGDLRRITEVTGMREIDGVIRAEDGRSFRGDERVSMNLWGFTPAIFAGLRTCFDSFLAERGRDPEAEFRLPDAVGTLVARQDARVQVLDTASPWFGLTHAADATAVAEFLRELTARGEYAQGLWPA